MLTPFGNLTVDWTKTGGNVNLIVGVPVGVTATVTIPGLQVLEGGKSIQPNGGVTVIGTTDHGTQVNVGSGTYSFSSVAK
jgi:alpha-L-rhamnosidase